MLEAGDGVEASVEFEISIGDEIGRVGVGVEGVQGWQAGANAAGECAFAQRAALRAICTSRDFNS